jgi:hypothetical protein
VLLCRQLDLFGRELLAVDGTRIKAVNNKDHNFTRASLTQFIKTADPELDDHLQRLDKSDATESAKGGSRVENLAEKIAAMRVKAELTKASSVPPRGSWRRPPPSTLPSRGIGAGSPGWIWRKRAG